MNSPKENRVPGGALFTGLFNEAFVANPFPLFTQLRSKGAVVAMPMPGRGSTSLWMITRLEEAVQVLKNKVFTVDPTTISYTTDQQLPPRVGGLGGLLTHSMIAVWVSTLEVFS